MQEERAAFSRIVGKDPEMIFSSVKTPAYVLDETALIRNGKVMKKVADETGARFLLAQKAFSNYDLYNVIEPFMYGTEASGLYEARLGKEEMPDKEVHVFCGAYREDEFEELLKYADHIVFNSPTQLARFGKRAKMCGKSLGLRINPEYSTQEGHEIYDPCAPGGRLGTTRAQWDELMTEELVEMLDGLHFHTLCEQDSDALKTTLEAVEERFGDVLPKMKWLNMGGGHHVSKPGYDLETLKECIFYAKNKWKLEIYLEPGEAWALNAGYLVTRVLDLPKNGNYRLAILDASAACHMPDVIEMPYTPPLFCMPELEDKEIISISGKTSDGKYIYRLGGPTCLSGDVIADYICDHEFKYNELLVFGDMAIYTTCKNNTFNGMPLPDIYVWKEDGSIEKLTSFGYSDFKSRLGRM